MVNLAVMFCGLVLLFVGASMRAAETAMLMGAILALCGFVLAISDAVGCLRNWWRLRRARLRNRRDWGPTVPNDQRCDR